MYENEDKATAFARNIERQCSLNQNVDEDSDWKEEVERRARRIKHTVTETKLEPATDQELQLIIKQLAIKKAPGIDEISNKIIKLFPRKSRIAFLNVTNAILREAYFPKRWKTALLFMLPKKQRSCFPQDYRPISLLPCLSKITERIILTRLQKELEENNTIIDEQFGFRKLHSTELQITRLTEYITEGYTRRQSTGAVFLDISKAFDKVWHSGLIYKMTEAGISTKLTQLIQSFLSQRKCKVKIGDAISAEVSLEAGVPQGAVLSPTLYSIYTNDIPKN